MLRMKYYFFIFLSIVLFSCGKEKVILLPEISHSEITKINDVSAAYLFYDETQKDSVELNRKNLISTTNWLVNVDKYLTLKEVIPQIKFLQEKKKNSGHKNKKAKNYFTCNDTSRKDLGFIEFTDIVYNEELFYEYASNHLDLDFSKTMKIDFNSSEEIYLEFPLLDSSSLVSKKTNLIQNISFLLTEEFSSIELILNFNKNLSFQDYTTFKYIISTLNLESVSISNHEFIY